MRISLGLGLGVLALGVSGFACGGGVSLGSVPSTLGSEDGGAGAADATGSASGTGPYDVVCTGYYRPATSDLEDRFTFRTDENGQKSISFPGYTVNATMAPSTDAPDAISVLTIAVPELGTVQRFRLPRDKQPLSFDQGTFTGLVYISDGLQYLCKTASPPTPASSSPSSQPAPFDVACVLELRASSGGAVERTETVLPAVNPKSTYALGDFGAAVSFDDDGYSGRALYVDLWKAPNTQGSASIRQFMQFGRGERLSNPLGGSLAGRSAVVDSAGREVSSDCAIR